VITLIHTGLSVPQDAPQVSALRELPTFDGVAFQATVRRRGRDVGLIENNGGGGQAAFRPYPGSGFGYDALNAFAAACRRGGEQVSTEGVFNDLVEFSDRSRSGSPCDLRVRVAYMSARATAWLAVARFRPPILARERLRL
jgi:hypothetical protein